MRTEGDRGGSARVIVVPGLAVRTYADEPVRRLRAAGFEAELEQALAWRNRPASLDRYAAELAARIEQDGAPVAALVGLSAGTQAAALTAAATGLVERLVLVSPTIEPSRRTMPRQIATWARGDPHESNTFFAQIPDWSRAGVVRILRGLRSTLDTPLEQVLPGVRAELTVIHAEYDPLTSFDYAARLAQDFGGRLLVAPGHSHSWPKADPDGFVELIQELTACRT